MLAAGLKDNIKIEAHYKGKIIIDVHSTDSFSGEYYNAENQAKLPKSPQEAMEIALLQILKTEI